MTTYSYAQLEALWLDAARGTKYATQTWAELMAAIAEAESSGNSDAFNPSGATGLWQILGAVNSADQSKLTDPTVNAHEALLKLESQGLGAWVTYTSGAYKQFLKSGVNPSSLPTSSGTPSSSGGSNAGLIGNLLGLPSQVTDFFTAADDFIKAAMWLVNPGHWFRIGAFFAGTVLLLFGVYLLAKTNGFELPKPPPVMPVPVPL